MIPNRTKETIDNYVDKKWKPGHFVTAVLSNDLKGAFGAADEENRRALFEIVSYVVNETPCICHGSREIVERWLKGEH